MIEISWMWLAPLLTGWFMFEVGVGEYYGYVESAVSLGAVLLVLYQDREIANLKETVMVLRGY